jgi:patatin-like phospholipase/acyl hydrolase
MLKLSEKDIISSTTRPYEYFDIIAGTSIGGLIAILLEKLGLSVEKYIQEQGVQEIFHLQIYLQIFT